VGSLSWAEDIPDWLREEIKHERMMYGLAGIIKADRPEWENVGDAELCAYLMTASLRAPMPHEYVEIYQYLTARLLKRVGREIPEDFRKKLETGLSKYEADELKDLKQKIYNARGGEIRHPLLDMLRAFKRECEKPDAAPKKQPVSPLPPAEEPTGQLSMFG
jgi:hypothetical protein